MDKDISITIKANGDIHIEGKSQNYEGQIPVNGAVLYSAINQPEKGQIVMVRESEKDYWRPSIFKNVIVGPLGVRWFTNTCPWSWCECAVYDEDIMLESLRAISQMED